MIINTGADAQIQTGAAEEATERGAATGCKTKRKMN